MLFAVDKAFCISIKERTDRQKIAKENLAKLETSLEFWLVDKDVENPERGCYNSHRDIAKYALENNYERVLIFEDDVMFHRIPSARELKRFNQFLKSNRGDIFYLGALLGRMWLTPKLGIARCSAFCTHSYILNKSGMEKLVDTPYDGTAVDLVYKRKLDSYLAFPMLTSQLPYDVASSDISTHRNDNVVFTDDSWEVNKRYQYWSALKNFKYTLLNRSNCRR
ncbi:glycosyltransferase family 25 protein [Endozoicomonas sp. SM1973]|uniref:Glycosyltransferase family 25 protein n=1 Tax=Spartinivicinus marinus TaxID=2994442 RepID=A0A853IDR6_9GAMM|nr:glycosyltransferase family 25 protein [Spartinivicinus marinus]MCX4026260.1 glycosyltransferase family 25 protein [Spartinivicinus marinus]NYZ67325.1 glycosyltransferase family 25 protein [Spartinivicinus marinus]